MFGWITKVWHKMFPSITQRVEAELARLSNLTVEEIAAYLESHGVKGYKGAARECVMAVYLSEKFDERILVFMTSVHIGNGNYVPTPETVREFISRFDIGLYPSLTK